MMFLCFFFFQAEDGIRDIGVTGVQTCALPISQVGAAVERWNLANVKLGKIDRDLSRTRFELGIAHRNLTQAQTDLARQAIEVYTAGGSTSSIEVLFGATSLGDLITRIDSVSRVSEQRSTLLSDITRFRGEIQRQAS